MSSTPRELMDAYVAAINANDIEAMLGLYSDDLLFFDAFVWNTTEKFEGWERRGIDELRKVVETWFASFVPGDHTRYDNLEIIEVGDIAAISARMLYKGESKDGTLEGMWNRYSSVARQIDGEWKLVFEHTSVPVDMETNVAQGFEDN